MKLILLGAPGAGKGTQAKVLAEKYSIPIISTGNILREAIAAQSELGLKVQDIMARGELVADDIIMAIVKVRLAAADAQNGYLLDGFPRTLEQAQGMRDSGIDVDHVIYLEVSDDKIVERMSGRLSHPASGRVYHKIYNPPKNSGVDDITGEVLVQRNDDRPEVVRNRLEVYRRQTAPLLEYYDAWQVAHDVGAPKLYKVNGMQEVSQVTQDVCAKLGDCK
jgi:adenylate kinase